MKQRSLDIIGADMNEYTIGDEVWFIEISDIPLHAHYMDSENYAVIFPCQINVKSKIIKRIWKNGNIAFEDGRTTHDMYVFKTKKEAMSQLIKHIEILDSQEVDMDR